MTKGVTSIALIGLLIFAGCAGHKGPTAADVTPAGTSKSTPPPPPATKPASQAQPVTATGSENQVAPPATVVTPSAAGNRPAAPKQAAAGEAPPATASAYVFSPQQAVAATPSSAAVAAAQGTTKPSPSKGAPPSDGSPQGTTDPSAPPKGELQLLVVVSANEVATGQVVTVDVVASSNTAVVDAPLHLSFGPNVLEFVDGVPGDFLTQGGSSVVFLADGRSRPGDVAIAAGRVVREQGASGSGLLCRVRLRGVAAGTSAVAVGQAKAWGTAGEELPVRSVGATVVVR